MTNAFSTLPISTPDSALALGTAAPGTSRGGLGFELDDNGCVVEGTYDPTCASKRKTQLDGLCAVVA